MGFNSFLIRRNTRLLMCLLVLCSVFLPGCIMITPLPKNDFSTLNDDALSNVLRQTLRPLDNEPRDPIDFQKKLADLFNGQSREWDKTYFASNAGECRDVENKNELFCQYTREWGYIRSYPFTFGLFNREDTCFHHKAQVEIVFKMNNEVIHDLTVKYSYSIMVNNSNLCK